jgi:acetyl-CoA C-acetyltransferase
MVTRLRERPNDTGLVTGLGWFSTKHAWGTYRATPPTEGFRATSVQSVVDAQPTCPRRQGDGAVTVETYTVVHGRDGQASHAVVAGRLHDGARVWSKTEDESALRALESSELIGSLAEVRDGVIYF